LLTVGRQERVTLPTAAHEIGMPLLEACGFNLTGSG